MTTEERFWNKVNKHGPKQKHMKTKCWLWTGFIAPDGYGKFRSGSVVYYAHRFSYELCKRLLGANPACHKCDIRNCVRPSHIRKGTTQSNVNDRQKRHRQAKGVIHGLSKLTDKQIIKIRKLYASGKYFQTQLAVRFNVSSHQISMIVNRKQWRHI